MVEILRNKSLATKLQILVAIADSGPGVQQQEIAKKLAITPQAVSDYVAQLIKEGLLTADGRSRYKVTDEGVNWIVRMLRELRNYTSSVEKVITNISVCTAIAEGELSKGETVGLKMKSGLLYATPKITSGARGVTTSDARPGEDVGVTNIDGIVKFKLGTVIILSVPGVSKGGSRNVDLTRLRREVKGKPFVGALGIEALVTLKQLKVDFHSYGVREAAIEAAHCGLQPVVVCSEDEISGLIKRLEEADISYRIADMTRK
jgi:putative transcriptional regulator